MASLWDRTQKLPKELFKQVEMVYGEHFPLEVRFQLAHWIEENMNPVVKYKADDLASQNVAVNIAQQLLAQLDAKAQSIPADPDKFLIKQKLTDISLALKTMYSNNLVGLFLAVKQCLEQELNIVNQVAGGAPVGALDQSMGSQIRHQLSILQTKVNDTGIELDRCRQEQEAVTVEFYSFKEMEAKFDAMRTQNGEASMDVKKLKQQRDRMEQQIRQKYMNLATQRTTLVNTLVSNFHAVKEVQVQVLDKELIAWKRDQQLAGNGLQMTLSLETLQEWCENLAQIIWSMRQQIKQLENLRSQLTDPTNTPNHIPDLLSGITDLLSNLVTGTFIIEKQPPQVMKTNTRFTSTVRLLVGGQLNVHMASPNVAVSIISENQANSLLTSPPQSPKRREDYSSGEILNGHGNMEFHAATRQVSVTFRNLQLKKIKRTEKKGTESVMEEKFSVLFWTDFQVGELKFQVWTLSLPVVVIVHGNQEPQALATITWDNAFAEWGRRPFVVPDKVSWAKMAAALNMKWTAACGTTRNLTEENLYYLACKAFRNNNLGIDDFKNLVLTWSQFCREPLPDRTFTFWEWFYRVMNLTANHMRGPWNDGYIMGFVAKHKAEEMLMTREGGCFLLRFSDSELGGVTIAYVRQDHSQNHSQKSVFMVAPFTTRDLSQRSIADVIFDLQEYLTILYPNTPMEAFRKFSNSANKDQVQPTSSGYVPHTLKTHVPGVAINDCMSNPATPARPQDDHYGMGMNHHYQGFQDMGMDDGAMDIAPEINFDVNQIDVNQILGIASAILPGQNMELNNYQMN